MRPHPGSPISFQPSFVHCVQGLGPHLLGFLLALVTAALLANAGSVFAAKAGPVATSPRFAPARILVAPQPGTSSIDFQQALGAQGASSLGPLPGIDVHVVEVSPGSEQASVAALAKNPLVRFAELDQLAPPAATANDPYFGNEWHLAKINAPTAWDMSTGIGITIAILDSGVDGTHPDIAAQLVPGWNFFDNNGNTSDVLGHGTAVAGVAAAASNNGVGIAGIAGGARVMAVRITDSAGYAYWSAAAQGLTWAADHGADVANISFEGMTASRTMQAAASYFRSKGGTVIVAAGNAGAVDNTAPTDTMVVVSGTDRQDRLTGSSTYGSFVDISAPGQSIYSTAKGGGYGSWSGTSMAAPMVAGTAALIFALRPDLTPSQVDSTLLASATDLGAIGRDVYFGFGRLDAAAALQVAAAIPVTTTPSSVVTTPTAAVPTCTRANPTITVTPSPGAGVPAGTMVPFNVAVTNNDTAACAASTFDLTRGIPAGWTATFLSLALSLSPGTGASTTLQVTSPAGTADSSTTLTATATNRSASTFLRSASATYVVANTVPGAPVIGAATAGNAQATVSFTAPASNGGSAISSYTVTSSPGGISASGAASPITVPGLTNGTAYTFTVKAANAVGTGAASAASNSVIPAAPIDANGSCAPTVSSTELLANPGFEGSYTNLATSWTYNRLGNPQMSFSKDATIFRGGSASQKITVSPAPDSSSFAYFLQQYTFKAGVTYEASVWLRSPDGATVTFLLRRAGPHYEAGATQQIKLTPTWAKYTIRGGWNTDVPGLFELNFHSAGTVNVDDASLREISNETDCVATQDPIPARFFGQHINKWGNYPQWPSLLNFKMLRLWDTGTRWMDIEPTKGNWNWSRFDYYVNTALKNNNEIVYTLGMTPSWASASSSKTAPPADIDDWRTYVRTVALRYKGKIKYWELWNETDYEGFYTGTVDQMYQLTVAARQELKTVDPTNVILAPNITTNGIAWLDKFLALGGGQYVDVVSWHRYTTYLPEADLPLLNSVKSVMAQRGVSKPIWNTEGATLGAPPSSESANGAIARSYIMLWSWGVQNHNWYGWDINNLGNPLSQSDYTTPTASGIAYQQTALWLTGSRMTSKHRDANGTWTITILQTNGNQAYIVWNETNPRQFTIPAGWSPQTKRDLTGATSAISGLTSVSIGPSPILLAR